MASAVCNERTAAVVEGDRRRSSRSARVPAARGQSGRCRGTTMFDSCRPCARVSSAAVNSAGVDEGDRWSSSAAAPATCGAAADVPVKPEAPQPARPSRRAVGAVETLSYAAMSGFVRPSIVGPSELYHSRSPVCQHTAPTASAAPDDAGSVTLCVIGFCDRACARDEHVDELIVRDAEAQMYARVGHRRSRRVRETRLFDGGAGPSA